MIIDRVKVPWVEPTSGCGLYRLCPLLCLRAHLADALPTPPHSFHNSSPLHLLLCVPHRSASRQSICTQKEPSGHATLGRKNSSGSSQTFSSPNVQSRRFPGTRPSSQESRHLLDVSLVKAPRTLHACYTVNMSKLRDRLCTPQRAWMSRSSSSCRNAWI